MGDPQPRVMLPQLGDQVVRHQAHRRRQSVQHDGHEGLQTESRFHDRSSEVSNRGRGGGEKKQHIVKKEELTFSERKTVLAVMAKVRM